MAERKVALTIRITGRHVTALEAEAKRTQVSPSEVLRRWLDPYADQYEATKKGLAAKLYNQS